MVDKKIDNLVFAELPTNRLQWTTAASRANLRKEYLQNFTSFESASNISKTQFLLLRTLIKRREGEFSPKEFNLEQEMGFAKEQLEDCKQFRGYLHMIRGNKYDKKDMLFLVRRLQLEILDPPVQGNKKLSSSDESPVNNTFMTFLQAIVELFDETHVKWRQSKISPRR
jgi:hypothetical protein